MKVLVAGTGSIGKRHIRNIINLDSDVEFIFIREDSREDEFSNSLEAVVVSDFGQGVKHSPDFLLIATPSSLHANLIIQAIERNIPMYIEKPLVSCNEDLDRIKKCLSINTYTAPSISGCNLRYLPSLQKLKAIIGDDEIGRVARASFHVGQWLPDWRPTQDYKKSYSAKKEMGGGVVLDLIHELDVARWLFGEFDITRAILEDFEPLDIKSESIACVILGKKNNTPVVSVCLDYVARRLIRKYEIVGEKGTLTWDLPNKLLKLESHNHEEIISSDENDFDMSNTYIEAMKELTSAINNGARTTQDIYDGILTTELALTVKGNA